ncbi:hypothetical protein WR25_13771 isoform E [Diploscapter pachys]|uniref:ABC1 atypical kinase-like domain-containing protein n=1 Tax=Diploscapter pachys TaxID=2018661 RepID=A0A2A2LJK3_9BILA|nr:hypothetical protein WR25_13771 isoform A [Diploscapter pachys]PAV86216.1 hypothetical protein WR25_13771 isoform C [Diploscapter pachys]PAV86218.1 hypothetical protein WR25_13771 isoform E [Diploscapter pachys]
MSVQLYRLLFQPVQIGLVRKLLRKSAAPLVRATFQIVRSQNRYQNVIRKSFILSLGIGTSLATRHYLRVAHCHVHPIEEDPWLLRNVETRPISYLMAPLYLPIGLWRFFRRFIRCISLFIRFGPLFLCYPLFSRIEFLHELWWKWLLFIVQTSGPTFIKLGQWGSTRRDIFSKTFCDRLSILHTKTKKQRLFRDQEKFFDEVYGKGFMKQYKDKVFKSIEPYSVGSGCIAQVYKATIDVPEFERAVNRKYDQLNDVQTQEIAIKVADKGVEHQIELDLSILRTFACVMQKVMPGLSYIDPTGALEQFELVLRRQVDLRNEARALIGNLCFIFHLFPRKLNFPKFANNFDPQKTGVRFPVVLGYTKNVIIETFEDGMYINRLVAEEDNSELKAKQSKAVRRRIALMGARALFKMIFVDNFIHGDLHPGEFYIYLLKEMIFSGNILIRFNENDNSGIEGVHKAPPPDSILKRGVSFCLFLFFKYFYSHFKCQKRAFVSDRNVPVYDRLENSPEDPVHRFSRSKR